MPLGNGTDWCRDRAGGRKVSKGWRVGGRVSSDETDECGFLCHSAKKFGYQCHDRKKSSSSTGLKEIFLVVKTARVVPGVGVGEYWL